MKTIPVGHGKYALIDDEDFDRVSVRKWSVLQVTRNIRYYATASFKGRKVYMHRFISNAEKGQYVDHINGNGLDNRSANIRLCSALQNGYNRKMSINNKVGFKGVQRIGKSFVAGIRIAGKQLHLGTFRNSVDAACAYNIAALKYFGEFAYQNRI